MHLFAAGAGQANNAEWTQVHDNGHSSSKVPIPVAPSKTSFFGL